MVAFRDQAFAIAVEGDGQAVTADELFARSDCDEDARAHLHALFDRAPAYEFAVRATDEEAYLELVSLTHQDRFRRSDAPKWQASIPARVGFAPLDDEAIRVSSGCARACATLRRPSVARRARSSR